MSADKEGLKNKLAFLKEMEKSFAVQAQLVVAGFVSFADQSVDAGIVKSLNIDEWRDSVFQHINELTVLFEVARDDCERVLMEAEKKPDENDDA